MDLASSPSTVPAGMPTPPASSIAPSSVASQLPQPRRHPLKPGSLRESDLIRYLDSSLNNVQKRVENRLQEREDHYDSFADVEKDLTGLVDVIWVSGSPNLQIPYLLNIARLIAEYIPAFPFSARPSFRLLDKLDSAFCSLLAGHDLDTGDPLPGFEDGRTVSTTDKVRLKSIVNRTRDVVVKHLTEAEDPAGNENVDVLDMAQGSPGVNATVSAAEETVKFEGFENNDEGEERWDEMQISRVYERTISELGDVLGGPPIGIITDD